MNHTNNTHIGRVEVERVEVDGKVFKPTTAPEPEWLADAMRDVRDGRGTPITCDDPIVHLVMLKFADRSKAGRLKYGVGMDRTDMARKQWLQHAQEEALDMAVYLERLIQDEPI